MEETQLDIHMHREHLAHHTGKGDPLTTGVSITIAVLAVATAIVGSVESMETSGAILESNKATLSQGHASDQWAFYQAKGIKKRLDEMTADAGGPRAVQAAEKARQEGQEQKTITLEARAFERERDQARASADFHEARHPVLTMAAALLQISIAISTIAIITRRVWPWIGALLGGALGLVFAASSFLPTAWGGAAILRLMAPH